MWDDISTRLCDQTLNVDVTMMNAQFKQW